MARTVEKYVNKELGVSVPLKLDVKTLKFSTTYNVQVIYAPSLDTLRTQVEALVYACHQIAWQRVSARLWAQRADPQSAQSDHQFVERKLAVGRLYVGALEATGRLKQVFWTCPTDQRLALSGDLTWHTERNGPFVPPCRDLAETYYNWTYLPYSDALWAQMSRLLRHLERTDELARGLFAQPELTEHKLEQWLALLDAMRDLPASQEVA